ncbi:hypothetical protein [Catellatospora sp. NPDC049609]|uniref:hypothetical protein n=1 Tax=Catellatospora sp. NPDC049609 TaxID=3155505 RepID=UPI00341B5756
MPPSDVSRAAEHEMCDIPTAARFLGLLDYREYGPGGEPSVAWFDTELGQDLRLARDFRAFVEGLTCDPGDEMPL